MKAISAFRKLAIGTCRAGGAGIFAALLLLIVR